MKLSDKIASSVKRTMVRVYLKNEIDELKEDMYSYVVVGEWKKIKEVLEWNEIEECYIETIGVNSALSLADLKNQNIRVEPGAIIREQVKIGDHAVILMGAIINSGCEIGKKTMVDMGAVIGGGVIVKENCHIGANAVLAGVVEPYSERGVIVEKDTFVGAGAVILEGVHVGQGVTIGANAVVNRDIPDFCVAVGIPAKIIKIKEKRDNFLVNDLRKL